MSGNTGEMGAGTSWAIVTANELASGMTVVSGLRACEDYSAAVADVYSPSSPEGQETQYSTSRRLASTTGEIIENWKRQGELPLTHKNFRPDLAKRHVARNFDPKAPRLSVAMQKLKVVRYALPEILRGRPPEATTRQPLDNIASNLARICTAGSFQAVRDPGGYDGALATSTWRPYVRSSRWGY